MNDYIPDPIELGEMRAERWLDNAEQPDGTVKCSCGRFCSLWDLAPVSDNPYSKGVCPDCLDELMVKWKDKK